MNYLYKFNEPGRASPFAPENFCRAEFISKEKIHATVNGKDFYSNKSYVMDASNLVFPAASLMGKRQE